MAGTFTHSMKNAEWLKRMASMRGLTQPTSLLFWLGQAGALAAFIFALEAICKFEREPAYLSGFGQRIENAAKLRFVLPLKNIAVSDYPVEHEHQRMLHDLVKVGVNKLTSFNIGSIRFKLNFVTTGWLPHGYHVFENIDPFTSLVVSNYGEVVGAQRHIGGKWPERFCNRKASHNFRYNSGAFTTVPEHKFDTDRNVVHTLAIGLEVIQPRRIYQQKWPVGPQGQVGYRSAVPRRVRSLASCPENQEGRYDINGTDPDQPFVEPIRAFFQRHQLPLYLSIFIGLLGAGLELYGLSRLQSGSIVRGISMLVFAVLILVLDLGTLMYGWPWTWNWASLWT